MLAIKPELPGNDALLDSIAFFRRMGNYLFLPLFLVFGFCTVIMLAAAYEPMLVLLKSTIFKIYSTLTLTGFVFWCLSKRPRPSMVFSVGILLATIDLMWISWLVYLLSVGQWKLLLLRSEWALVVMIGIGAASIKCFRFWATLRQMDSATLDAALRTIAERKLLRKTTI